MRCRKALSLTSAFSNDELEGRKLTALREHLACCPECRAEVDLMRSIRTAGSSLLSMPLSGDFNSKLLNRIARERFAETRTKAYFPRLKPISIWPRLATLSVSAVAVLLTLGMFIPGMMPDGREVGTGMFSSVILGEDDSYLTAEPSDNPRAALPLKRNWSLNQQLARSERISRISSNLTAPSGFGNQRLAGSMRGSALFPRAIAPYSVQYFRVRPVIVQYRVVLTQPSGGSKKEY